MEQNPYQKTFGEFYDFQPEDLDGREVGRQDLEEDPMAFILSTGQTGLKEETLYLGKREVLDAGIQYIESGEKSNGLMDTAYTLCEGLLDKCGLKDGDSGTKHPGDVADAARENLAEGLEIKMVDEIPEEFETLDGIEPVTEDFPEYPGTVFEFD